MSRLRLLEEILSGERNSKTDCDSWVAGLISGKYKILTIKTNNLLHRFWVFLSFVFSSKNLHVLLEKTLLDIVNPCNKKLNAYLRFFRLFQGRLCGLALDKSTTSSKGLCQLYSCFQVSDELAPLLLRERLYQCAISTNHFECLLGLLLRGSSFSPQGT